MARSSSSAQRVAAQPRAANHQLIRTQPNPRHNVDSARRPQRLLAIMLRFRYISTALRESPPLAWTLKLPAFVAARCVEDLKCRIATEIDGKISRGAHCRRRNPVALNERAEPFGCVDRLLQPEAVAVVLPAERGLSIRDDSPRGADSQHDTT